MFEAAPKELLIHIGAQKTASALLRRTAASLKPELAEAGLYLMTRSEVSAAPFHDYIHRMNLGQLSRHDRVPQDVAHSLSEVANRPEPRVLIMSESLFSRLPLESFFQNVSESLAFLRDEWAPHRLRLILYVRRQPSFIVSCYAQFISMGRTFSFDEFTGGDLPDHLNWHTVCSDISSVIGRENLIVRPYEMIGQSGAVGYAKDFLETVGLDASLAERAGEIAARGAKSNRGLSQPAIEIARAGNAVLPAKERLKLRKFLQNTFSTATHAKPEFWSPEQEADLKAHYAGSNGALFREFMPDRDPVALGYL